MESGLPVIRGTSSIGTEVPKWAVLISRASRRVSIRSPTGVRLLLCSMPSDNSASQNQILRGWQIRYHMRCGPVHATSALGQNQASSGQYAIQITTLHQNPRWGREQLFVAKVANTRCQVRFLAVQAIRFSAEILPKSRPIRDSLWRWHENRLWKNSQLKRPIRHRGFRPCAQRTEFARSASIGVNGCRGFY